jgi:hypothetical protein
MTRSAELIARVRALAHQERNASTEACRAALAPSLSAAALDLAGEHEILVAQALAAERAIHSLVKDGEGKTP